MKIIVAAAALALLAVPALAQSPSKSDSQASQPSQSAQSTQSNQQVQAAAQKIQQDLQREGFTDVKVVAESFVVQGKTPDGNPVLMTIGPHGMSVFEAMNASGSNSGTVGSNPSSSGSSTSAPSNSSSPKQQK